MSSKSPSGIFFSVILPLVSKQALNENKVCSKIAVVVLELAGSVFFHACMHACKADGRACVRQVVHLWRMEGRGGATRRVEGARRRVEGLRCMGARAQPCMYACRRSPAGVEWRRGAVCEAPGDRDCSMHVDKQVCPVLRLTRVEALSFG